MASLGYKIPRNNSERTQILESLKEKPFKPRNKGHVHDVFTQYEQEV